MKIMRVFIATIAALANLAVPSLASAQSITVPADVSRTIGNNDIPRDTAAKVIYDYSAGQTLTTTNASCQITEKSTVSGTRNGSFYTTSNSGVAIWFEYISLDSGGWQTAPFTRTFSLPNNGTTSYNIYRRANLVVGGPIASGTLSGLPSLTITYSGSCIPTTSTTLTLVNGATVITPLTCDVTTSTVNVTLPSVPASQLSPAGSTAGDTAFSIGLNCATGSNVHVTLTDLTTPGNRTAQLSLSPSSTAQGVQLRILKGGSPLSFGPDSALPGTTNQFSIGASSGLGSVDLTAQYISTGTVSPGSVSAVATFTMSYQ